jgi:hypothetical protein
MRKKNLTSTILYNINLTSTAVEMNDLINHLIDIFQHSDPVSDIYSKKAWRRNLLNLICNLSNCETSDRDYIAYRRGDKPDEKRFFTSRSRYNPERITIYQLKKVISTFLEHELIAHTKGINYAGKHGSWVSRMCAADKLIALFKQHKISQKDIICSKNTELIILKKSKRLKKLKINYRDDKNTRSMREKLKAYNALLAKSKISINGVEQAPPAAVRIFNNSSFTQGGRIYHCPWQSCKSKERESIKINNQSTIEIDYQSLHLSMLYHLSGRNFVGDLYSFGKHKRSDVKRAVNIILNSGSRQEAEGATLMKLREKDKLISIDFVANLHDSILLKHPIILDYVNENPTVNLQYRDSCLATDIIEVFTNKGIAVLSVHDSFIIDRQYSVLLYDVMTECYLKAFNFKPIINQKGKQKSPDLRKELSASLDGSTLFAANTKFQLVS